MTIREFLERHYRHFNAASTVEAATAYGDHVDAGGAMMVTLAGAMSTAEVGVSLAEMIRREKVHAITCTGANLEEDLFNLVAHRRYRRVTHWRNLTRAEEKELLNRGFNRVTDTCIPEEEAIRAVEEPLLALWSRDSAEGRRRFAYEYFYELVKSGVLAGRYEIDPQDSWLAAAAQRDLPLFVPGWEDSTLGNIFVARVLEGTLAGFDIVRSGTETMGALVDWYLRTTVGQSIANEKESRPTRAAGFFQIGGGIAGDFPICVVPLIQQDLGRSCPCWSYFCQISDATMSYGSYSGAPPSEKISWGKLDVDTPAFLIESDATIVAPLIFAHVLGW